MAWPLDEAKLNRVRALMKDQDLSALVVRAPDNVLYLTNYWCMKGYDAVVFPREGDPALIVLEPQLADAERNSWTKDLRLFKGYDERDPRPPQYRALDLALEVLEQQNLTDKVGIELNMGTQSADRMVGEPTTPTQNYFDAFRKISGQVVDATPLLNEARAIKTSQEIERMRLANELAALAMEHTREHMRPGMKESEVGGMYESFVHGLGVGYKGKVEMVSRGIKTGVSQVTRSFAQSVQRSRLIFTGWRKFSRIRQAGSRADCGRWISGTAIASRLPWRWRTRP